MSIGKPQQRPNELIGEEVDDFLIEHLGFVRIYAEVAQKYVEVGDGAGLNHAMRHLIARVKGVAGLLNDLTASGAIAGGPVPPEAGSPDGE